MPVVCSAWLCALFDILECKLLYSRLFIRVFPQKPITSIPLETRMGKGKGEPEYWAAVVKPGTVLYEISGVPEEGARLCFTRLAHKMPVKVRFLRRRPV